MKIRADQLTPDHLGRWVTVPGKWSPYETREDCERAMHSGIVLDLVDGKRILLKSIEFSVNSTTGLVRVGLGASNCTGIMSVGPQALIDVETPACCNHTCCCKERR